MTMNNIFSKIALTIATVGVLSVSCTDDLNRFPANKSTSDIVYSDFDGYFGAATKVYASLALTGNKGAAGEADIKGIDEGNYTSFVRGLYYMQTLPTEESLCTWLQDDGIEGINSINFSPNNPVIKGFYYRCGVNITFANDFIRNSADGILDGKGFSEDEKQKILTLKDEVRFLRAYNYWIMLDLFGNPPFFTEDHKLGTLPIQTNRKDLFNYLESELLTISGEQGKLGEPRSQATGRVDKAAAWALLSRLYLNAEVYVGQAKYTEAATYAKKVIDAGYGLMSNYEYLFLADNNTDNDETVFMISFNGNQTKTFGGTTFLINCGFNASIQSEYGLNYGISTNAGWGGMRSRAELSNKFAQGDKRNLFVGKVVSIDDVTDFTQGRATYKYRNINRNGNAGSNSEFADNDFPVFRLAEMYLTYAEAIKRGGTGNASEALTNLNKLRERAFGGNSKNYASFGQVTLDEILNERARELYWECQRRTDLIRYNYFTSSDYVWEWKGNVRNGRGVSSHLNLYPIPSSELVSNTNLKQNSGY